MSRGHVEIHSRGVRVDSTADEKCARGCVHQVVPVAGAGLPPEKV